MTIIDRETLTNIVAKKRKELKVTQEELANAVNVSRQTIISIEKGNYAPSVSLALKIAHYFTCSVDEIFFLSDDISMSYNHSHYTHEQ